MWRWRSSQTWHFSSNTAQRAGPGKGCGVLPSDVLVIADAKRGDIGNTASRYARAMFEDYADAATVAPYMGRDSIEPFTAFDGRWTILLLTSNASANDFEFHGNTRCSERSCSKARVQNADRLMYVVRAADLKSSKTSKWS